MIRPRFGTQQVKKIQSGMEGGTLVQGVAQPLIITPVVICKNGLAEENTFAGVMIHLLGAGRNKRGIHVTHLDTSVAPFL